MGIGQAALARLRRRLPSKRIMAGAGVLGLGTAIGQSVAFLSSPFLTRYYTPEQFGLLAIYIALMSNLSTISSLRYEVAIPLPSDERDGAALVRGSLLLSGITSLFVALAAWSFPLAKWLGIQAGACRVLAVTVPIATLAVGMLQVLSYWHLRKKAFLPITAARGGQAALGAMIQILLACFESLRPVGLVLGDLAGRLGAFLGLGVFGDKTWIGSRDRAESWTEMKEAMGKHREFPLFGTFAALFNGAAQATPVIGLTVLFGPAVAGLYALSSRVIGAPIQFLGQTLSQVYLSEGSGLLRENPRKLRKHTLALSAAMVAITTLPIAALAVWGTQVFTTVFGPRWGQTGLIIRALVPMYLCDIAVTPIGLGLYMMKKTQLALAWDATRFALLAAIFIACYRAATSLRFTLVLFGGGMALMNVVLFLLIVQFMGKLSEKRA